MSEPRMTQRKRKDIVASLGFPGFQDCYDFPEVIRDYEHDLAMAEKQRDEMQEILDSVNRCWAADSKKIEDAMKMAAGLWCEWGDRAMEVARILDPEGESDAW